MSQLYYVLYGSKIDLSLYHRNESLRWAYSEKSNFSSRIDSNFKNILRGENSIYHILEF